MTSNKGLYYDWQRTMSYDAHVTMVVTARGAGKTYGIRKAAINDYIKNGYRFVEIVRYKTALKGESAVQNGYFDKLVLKNEFPDYVFKTQGTSAYIAKKPENEDDKVKWEKLGYFVALSEMQQSKQRTFANVRKIIFDEFVIDKRTGARYLPGEYGLFVNLIDSCAREEVDEEGHPMGTPVHAYLLGNACDLINPYFQHWRIADKPKQGYTWLGNHTALLHFDTDKTYAEGKKDTLVGKLVAGTSEENIIIGNEFNIGDDYNIAKKSSRAAFTLGLLWHGAEYGIWEDFNAGLVYVCNKVPKDSGKPILALSRADDCANVMVVKRSEKTLRIMMEYYYSGLMRFQNAGMRENFLGLMESLGIR